MASRFVRSSKYRNIFCAPSKKENTLENVKVTNNAWDTNLVAASGSYISLNWNASGGGAFAILPLPNPFGPIPGGFPSKLPDILPLARSHTSPVLDTAWSPFNDSVVASGGEDGKIMIWKVEASLFDGWGQENWVPEDFDPVAHIDGAARKIGHVLFHPTAQQVLASATKDVVKLWDLGSTESPKSTLGGHSGTIQSLAFNPVGNSLVTTCVDKKIRLFDPRTGGDPVRISSECHTGIKSVRVVWMGENDAFATTGFGKKSDREVGIWDAGSLTSSKITTLDQSSGVIMPFWSDNGILFLAGKGDGNIRCYEYANDSLFDLPEHKSSEPQRGMCFLPRRALRVDQCEIARAYKVTASGIEPIAFIVPRKSDSFQSDIYPPVPSSEPSLTAGEFFSGQEPTLKLVSLESGAVSTPTTTPLRTTAFTDSPAISRSASLATPVSVAPPPAPAPVIREPVSIRQEATFSPPPIIPLPTPNTTEEAATLRDENSKLNVELREARAQIRNLELQLEAVRANTRKAAQLLSNNA